MRTISVKEAQDHLAEIIDKLAPGEEVIITRDDKPVATIKATPPPTREPPKFGTLKGKVNIVDRDWWKPMTSDEVDAYVDGR